MSDSLENELKARWDEVRGAHIEPPAPSTELSAELVATAGQLVIWTQFGSTSMVQRRMRISFRLAGQVMDELVRFGVVGPKEEGSRSYPPRYRKEGADAVYEHLSRDWTPALGQD